MTTIARRQHAVKRCGRRTTETGTARTPAGDAFSRLVTRVFRLNGLLASAGDELARPAGQTSSRWQVLAMVEDEPATVAGIARTLGLARQSVQRIADLLEADGLIAYRPNPRHARARLVELTVEGRTTLATIQAAQRPWANRIGAAVGVPDLDRATGTLDRLIDTLERERSSRPSGRVAGG